MKTLTRFYNSVRFQECDIQYEVLGENLRRIAPIIKEVKFEHFDTLAQALCHLLDLIPSVETLEILNVTTRYTNSFPVVSHGFKKLKTLVLKDGQNRETAFYLSLFRDVTWLEKLHLQEAFELISQQKELKEFTLGIKQEHEWTVKNDDIQVTSLEVNAVFQLTETSRRNLEQFVKSQKKIESFSCNFPNERNKVFYSSMLKHLQTLETLRTITVENIGVAFNDFPVTDNYHVESLTIRQMFCGLADRKYIELFPNLKKLEIYLDSPLSNDFIQLLNNLATLEELLIIDLGKHGYHDLNRISHFQIKNLRKFELYSYDGCRGDSIVQFTKNHPDLLEFRLSLHPIKESTYLEVLESTLKNLKNLKKLMMFIPFRGWLSVVEVTREICKLIGENAPQLEALAVNFGVNDYTDVSRLGFDHDYWDSYIREISGDFERALPNLKFKFLCNFTREPWK